MDDSLVQLENLYRDTAPALLAYFRCRPALAGSAEDLVQDTFVRALRGFGRVNGSVAPTANFWSLAHFAPELTQLQSEKRL